MDGRQKKTPNVFVDHYISKEYLLLSTGPIFLFPNSCSRSSTIDHASTGTVPCVNVNQAVKGWKKARIFLLVRTELWDPRYGDRLRVFKREVLKSCCQLGAEANIPTGQYIHSLFYTLCKVTRGPKQERLEKELDRVKRTLRLWRSCAP